MNFIIPGSCPFIMHWKVFVITYRSISRLPYNLAWVDLWSPYLVYTLIGRVHVGWDFSPAHDLFFIVYRICWNYVKFSWLGWFFHHLDSPFGPHFDHGGYSCMWARHVSPDCNLILTVLLTLLDLWLHCRSVSPYCHTTYV